MKCSKVIANLHRLLPGGAGSRAVEEHAALCPSCAKALEQWRRIEDVLRSAPAVETPAGLAQDILQAAAQHDLARRAGGWMRSAAVPRLVWGTAAALLVATGVLVPLYRPHPRQAASAMETAATVAPELVPVTFRAAFPLAHEVAIAGDFNRWDTQSHRLRRAEGGAWEVSLRLPRGSYQYLFVVDNKDWRPDPDNPMLIDDGFGGRNSGIEL